VDDLPLQIRLVHDVKVDDAERAYTRRGQVEQGRGAQPARADAEDLGVLEPLLPGHPDLRDDQVSRVALDLVNGQLGSWLNERWQ